MSFVDEVTYTIVEALRSILKITGVTRPSRLQQKLYHPSMLTQKVLTGLLMAAAKTEQFRYSTVDGIFSQDMLSTDPGTFDYVGHRISQAFQSQD